MVVIYVWKFPCLAAETGSGVVLYRRRQQIKTQFSSLKHPNILRTLEELSRSSFFLESIISKMSEMKTLDCRKKFDRESSSKVRKMLGCLKCKYKNLHFYFPMPYRYFCADFFLCRSGSNFFSDGMDEFIKTTTQFNKKEELPHFTLIYI